MKQKTQFNEKKKLNDSGVSPVIGVMLMLVVTIIIAAFVAAFAGESAGSTSKAPVAAFEVSILSGQGVGTANQTVMLIKHVSGESIPSSDLEINSYYTSPDGKTMVSGSLSKNTPAIKVANMNFMSKDSDASTIKIPFLNDLNKGLAGKTGTNFGEFTLNAGDCMSTGDSYGTAVAILGAKTTDTEKNAVKLFDTYNFGKGSIVEVNIIHTPSRKTIYTGKVTVQ